MEKLQTLLEQLYNNLLDLGTILDEEQKLLCAGRINGSALQQITEKKSSLLATMQYLEEGRHKEENRIRLQAPYDLDGELNQLWDNIQNMTQSLHNKNQHNGLLLKQHIAYTNEALDVLKPRHTQSLYGPDGYSKNKSISGRKISI
ncbi:flagellar biosynthesis protein FlgN [Prodigiosinella confusarubida]|uniref:Flagellar biosynthesis protein FlgN n=1 Tax=Serratia sp. (strain ATCC 39006) TaxID=104623 RepID=A0A2I5T700_SERS3|nr:flagellar export chaperone FlgN [Serratia sp. ATCC 39006]AUH00360.1 flagellar biosynthesis protein FlgN [Serratia sp. ATCC 39006]AUH04680.1 flagellar biosynthesis protein FlgN [Serratia sp. ATCC 39006]